MAENIDKYTYAGYQEESYPALYQLGTQPPGSWFLLLTGILRQRTVPPSLDGIHIKPLFCQLCGILAKSQSSATLNQGESQNRPEHPRQLEHFLELELFVLLRQLLICRSIAPPFEILVAILIEEPEHDCGGIGEEVHENGRPEDPGEVSSFLSSSASSSGQFLFVTNLCYDVRRRLSHKSSDLIKLASNQSIKYASIIIHPIPCQSPIRILVWMQIHCSVQTTKRTSCTAQSVLRYHRGRG